MEIITITMHIANVRIMCNGLLDVANRSTIRDVGGTQPEAFELTRLLDIHDYRDTEGRPIGEHRASAPVRQASAMVLKQCPYADSRFQHAQPMNVSALRQLTAHWDDILTGVSFVRHEYLRRRGLQAVEQTKDCVAIGEAIASIPSYIIHRATNAAGDGAIDPLVGGVYKVIIGVNRVFALLLSGELMSTARVTRMSSPEDVAEYADLGGFLIGAEQVCAGSGRQIGQAIEAVVNGSRAPAFAGSLHLGPSAPAFAGSLHLGQPPAASALQSLLEPLDSFFAFAEAMRRVEAAKFLVKAAATVALVDALEKSPPLRETITALIGELDPSGAMQNFASSRSADQIDRLLQGWFELAGGDRQPVRKVDDTGWTARFATTPLAEQLVVLLAVERRVAPVVAETERQLNAALGRRAPLVTDARRVSRNLGMTALDQLSTALGVDLDPLMPAAAS